MKMTKQEMELKSLLTKEEYDYYIGCDVHHNIMLWNAAGQDPEVMAKLVKDWYGDIGEE